MSSAAERRARVGAAVDRAWGEGFLLTPRCRPEGDADARPIADPTRPIFDFVGRFMSAAQDLHARSRATSIQTTRPTSTATPTVTVQRAALRCAPQDGDLLTRLASSQTFVVGKVADGQFDRLVLHLRPASA